MSRNTTRKITWVIRTNDSVNDETAIIGPRPSGGAENLSYSDHFPTIPTEPANAYYYSQPRKQRTIRPGTSRFQGILVQKAIMSPQVQGNIKNALILLTSDLPSCAPFCIQRLPLNTAVQPCRLLSHSLDSR